MDNTLLIGAMSIAGLCVCICVFWLERMLLISRINVQNAKIDALVSSVDALLELNNVDRTLQSNSVKIN